MKPTIGRIVIYRSRTGNWDIPMQPPPAEGLQGTQIPSPGCWRWPDRVG